MSLQGIPAGLKAKLLAAPAFFWCVSWHTSLLMLYIHCAGQKAAAYIPGTDANRESKDRQYEEGYRSTPGTGTGSAYGTATSGYGTGSSQNTSGTGGMTTGEPDLHQILRQLNM